MVAAKCSGPREAVRGLTHARAFQPDGETGSAPSVRAWPRPNSSLREEDRSYRPRFAVRLQ
ncbi:hypothetical protein ABTN14_19710, partial [Acinetobacter baumannii]